MFYELGCDVFAYNPPAPITIVVTVILTYGYYEKDDALAVNQLGIKNALDYDTSQIGLYTDNHMAQQRLCKCYGTRI